MTGEPSAGQPIDDGEPQLSPGYRLTFVLDPDGRVRHVAEVSGIAAWPEDGLVGRTLSDISTDRAGGERGDLWNARIELAREATAPALYLDRVPGTASDAPESVSSTIIPVRTADGTLESFVVTLEDRFAVGPREAQVRQSEARFRYLAEALPQMVWESDGAGNVRYFSPKWEEFTGRPLGELLGRGYADLIHPDDVPMLVRVRERAQTTDTVTYRLRRHDGEYRWIEAHMTMVRDDAGNPVQALGTALDVTERRAAEDARLQSQKREMVGTLLGGIAHDFNNVISAILSNASLARRELVAGTSPSVSLSEIERGAARAAELVQRVLAQGRDTGASLGPVDVGAVVREACDLLRSGLPSTVDLHVSVEPALPLATGDATQIHQLVVNLVTNAGQAIAGQRGTITVDVAADDRLAIGDAERRAIVVRVRDDGPGMSADVLQRAFDPYFTTKPAGKGTGLGLWAVQTIVRNHDGDLELSSVLGDGTTFTVRLPASDVTPDPAPDFSGAPAELRLMFVDDEAALVKLAERALPVDGLNPIGFTDPEDALVAFAADPRRWSALVTDLSMPGIDGFTLIERVRSTRPDLPVVLTSGYLRPDDHARAQKLGVGAIVPKPCSMADLAAAVAKVTAAPTA